VPYLPGTAVPGYWLFRPCGTAFVAMSIYGFACIYGFTGCEKFGTRRKQQGVCPCTNPSRYQLTPSLCM
ncbi:MAG TPA: hypothetical protein VN828_14550, partial [Acidobacteriaceae bacterium]|nr:hypothetical protein [Acidobacteriaceae bacterium]